MRDWLDASLIAGKRAENERAAGSALAVFTSREPYGQVAETIFTALNRM